MTNKQRDELLRQQVIALANFIRDNLDKEIIYGEPAISWKDYTYTDLTFTDLGRSLIAKYGAQMNDVSTLMAEDILHFLNHIPQTKHNENT